MRRPARENVGRKKSKTKVVFAQCLHASFTVLVNASTYISVTADKPLKKRKQDSYPQESGAETMDGPTVQGSNMDSSLMPRKAISASNGGSRPALMVSIDLEKAGRLIGQPVVVLDSKPMCDDLLRHGKPDGKVDKVVVENRTDTAKQHTDNPKRTVSDGQTESPKLHQERQSESKRKPDSRIDNDKGHSENKRLDTPRQKHNRHSDKNHDGHQSHVSQPEAPKPASKIESISRHGDDKVRERNKDADRHRNKEKLKDREVGKDRDRMVEKDRDKDKDRNEHKDIDKDRDRDKNKVIDKNRNREKDRERNKNIEIDKDRERKKHIEIDKERDRNKDKEIDKDRERKKNIEIDKVRDRHRDKETDKDRERNKNIDIDKVRDRNRDKEIDKDRDRNRDKDKDRNKDKERDADRIRNKDRDREKDRSRDKDRERERKLQTFRENSRQSPDRHDKLESSTGKQDRSRKFTDTQSRQRTENSCSENTQNKEERRSGDASISCQARSKHPSLEMKPVEFPAYLLGGKSGSLKNFVIPKLSRDGRDPHLPSKLKSGWAEPLVRLERVSLVESLKNKAKPVVVLQRLGVDEVKRIIEESRNAHSSKSRKWSTSNKSERGRTE